MSCQTHCCILHGCKYGKATCKVASGEVKQEYPCEDCGPHWMSGPEELYVLCDELEYDGSNNVGLFSSAEAARMYAEHIEGKRLNWDAETRAKYGPGQCYEIYKLTVDELVPEIFECKQYTGVTEK